MKISTSLTIAALGFISITQAYAECPVLSSKPKSKDEVVSLIKDQYKTSVVEACEDLVVDAIDANAVEVSADADHYKKTTKGVRTTTIYKCAANTDTGKKLMIYAKVEKFEPTGFGRGDSFSMISGDVCSIPEDVFYRVTNSYRVVK